MELCPHSSCLAPTPELPEKTAPLWVPSHSLSSFATANLVGFEKVCKERLNFSSMYTKAIFNVTAF